VDDKTLEFARHWWESRQTTFFQNTWLGAPSLQNPFDAWVIQEIIYETRPDVIVETGTFGGGGAALWASLLAMVGDGTVISIDVEPNVSESAMNLPVVKERVEFVTGSSVNPEVSESVGAKCAGKRVMVILDSDHKAEHVTRELDTWSPLVTPGCYLVAEDGFVTAVDDDFGEGPREAVERWLPEHPEFAVDAERERMLFTFCTSGFLRRKP
jgi:cephalosporin hydroxylase